MHRSLSDWLARRHVLARRVGHGLPLLAALGYLEPNTMTVEGPRTLARFIAPRMAPTSMARRFFHDERQAITVNWPPPIAPVPSDVDWLAEDESITALVEPVSIDDDLSEMVQADEFVAPPYVANDSAEPSTTEARLPSTSPAQPEHPRPEVPPSSNTSERSLEPLSPLSATAESSPEPVQPQVVPVSQPRQRRSRIIEEDAVQPLLEEPGVESDLSSPDVSESSPSMRTNESDAVALSPPETPSIPAAAEAQGPPVNLDVDANETLGDVTGEQKFDRSPQAWYERLVAQARHEARAREQLETPVPPPAAPSNPAQRSPRVPTEAARRTSYARPSPGLPRVPASPIRPVLRSAGPSAPVIRSHPLLPSRTPADADPAGGNAGDDGGLVAAMGNDGDPTSSPTEPDPRARMVDREQDEAAAEPGVEAGMPSQSVAPPALPDKPVQWPESTRRFLAPRLGIDPRTVPIQQGAATDRLLTRLDADAATDGQSVLIQSTSPPDSPEALGTLAHELTHITRARQPGFVPPVARATADPQQGLTAASLDHGVPEEAIARDVEGQIRAAARRFVAGHTLAPDAQSVDPTIQARPRQQRPSSIAAESEQAVVPSPSGFQDSESTVDPSAMPDEWGALPKPWQPLPSWLAEPASEGPADRSQPANARSYQVPPSHDSLTTSTNGTNGLNGSALALADTGRDISEASALVQSEPVARPPDEAEKASEPDLDALSRQVYAVLRRRLATERRRSGWPG